MAMPALGAVRQLSRAHDTPVVARDRTVPRVSLGRPFHVLLAAVLLFGLANSSDTLLLLRARSAGLSASDLAFLARTRDPGVRSKPAGGADGRQALTGPSTEADLLAEGLPSRGVLVIDPITKEA
jgi:hypothetical protein